MFNFNSLWEIKKINPANTLKTNLHIKITNPIFGGKLIAHDEKYNGRRCITFRTVYD